MPSGSTEAGQLVGISDVQTTQILNSLVTLLVAPDWVNTSVKQDHFLRVQLALREPFMADTLMSPGASHIPNGIMSPAQAIHVLSMLFFQKLANIDWQSSDPNWRPPNRMGLRSKMHNGDVTLLPNPNGSDLAQILNGISFDAPTANRFIDTVADGLGLN